jgi:hypothetical protein
MSALELSVVHVGLLHDDINVSLGVYVLCTLNRGGYLCFESLCFCHNLYNEQNTISGVCYHSSI